MLHLFSLDSFNILGLKAAASDSMKRVKPEGESGQPYLVYLAILLEKFHYFTISNTFSGSQKTIVLYRLLMVA